MLTHLGFSAWIECDGQPLSEYLVSVDPETNCMSCWVPGTPGHKFTVFWQDHDGQVDSCSYITLDGLVVPGRFLYGHGVAARSGARVARNAERPFVFKSIQESASIDPSTSSAKDVGMITLKIKRITRVATRYANAVKPLPDAPPVLGKRKAGDLCAGFGEEETAWTQSQATWHVLPYPYNANDPPNAKPSTYVSFVFRYRTLDFLEEQGIASEATKWNHPVTMPMQMVPAIPPPLPTMPLPFAALPPPIPPQAEQSSQPPAKKPRLSGVDPSATASTSRAPSVQSVASTVATPITPYLPFPPLSAPSPLIAQSQPYDMTAPEPLQTPTLASTTASTASTPASTPAVASGVPDSHGSASAGPSGSKSRSTSKSKPRAAPKPRLTSKSRVPSGSSVASTSRAPSTSNKLTFPTELRRTSAEAKRIMSWTGTTPNTIMLAGGYQGEAQFFIPHNPHNFHIPAPTDSSDTSESATTPPNPLSPTY